jgi:hypothetical protein
MGESGSVDDRTTVEAAGGVRRILAAIDAGELSCSAAYRNLLQGAVVALESLARQQPQIDGTAPGSPSRS